MMRHKEHCNRGGRGVPHNILFLIHTDGVLALKKAAKGDRITEKALWKRLRKIEEHMMKHGAPPPNTTALREDVFVHTFTLDSTPKRRTMRQKVGDLFQGEKARPDHLVYYIAFEHRASEGRVRFFDVGLYVNLLRRGL